MHISFHLVFREDQNLDGIREETQEFIENLEKWQEKPKNRYHEIYVYVNQR